LARDVFFFAVPVVFFADAFLTPDFDRAVVFLAADFFVAVFFAAGFFAAGIFAAVTLPSRLVRFVLKFRSIFS